MEGVCIRHTEFPASTPLFTDYLYAFERVRGFYSHPPEFDRVQTAAKPVPRDLSHRRRLVEALREENRNGGPATERHLEALLDPETVAVATGQQVGLYGGPAFAVYKAATAIRLAAGLRDRGTPAVPVFWLATEDHDQHEVDHAWIFNSVYDPVRIEASVEPAPQQPVGPLVIRDAALDQLEQGLRGLPFDAEAVSLAREAYPAGASFGAGFAALFRRLFENYGLILLDPMNASVRRLAAPVIRAAIERGTELNRALIERSRALENAGYHAQVRVTEEGSLFFLLESGRRSPVKRNGSAYRSDGASWSAADLLRRLDENPAGFSPNALLRPVVQDFLLPTAAYIGGPAELAYLAQANVLYQEILGRAPVALPRASMTLLDTHAERLLKRYRLSLPECFQGLDSLRERIAHALIPPGLEQSFDENRRKMEEALARLNNDLAAFDPTLAAALETSRRKILYQFGKIRRKAAREGLRRDERASAHARLLSHFVAPEKGSQERLYSFLPLLARHGPDAVDRLYQAINPDCHDHQVLVL